MNTYQSTESQKEIWIASKMSDHASLAYNETVTIELTGKICFKTLEKAIFEAIQRHDSLRIIFSSEGVNYFVTSGEDADIKILDYSEVNNDEVVPILETISKQEAVTCFDLEKGPLMRSKIVKLNENKGVLIICIHHIVCDGWSYETVARDIAKIYNSIVENNQISELPISNKFSDYSLSKTNNKETASNDLKYWIDKFKNDVPFLDLPTDFKRPHIRTYDSGYYVHDIDQLIFKEITKLSDQLNISRFTIYLACYFILMHRLTGQSRVVVGMPVAGQLVANCPDLVGHCMNFLPLLSELDREVTFEQYLLSVRSIILDASSHQEVVYGNLVDSLDIKRDPSRIPLLSTAFTVTKTIDDLHFNGISSHYVPQQRYYEAFEIFIGARESDNGLRFRCHYNSNLFTSETIKTRFSELETILQELTTNQKKKISKCSLLPEKELNLLLSEWNDTKSVFDDNTTFHWLFENQSKKTPNRIAVEVGDERLTYKELNERCDKLAQRLHRKGKTDNSVVGVYLKRGIDMVIAIISVLKSGRSFLPLDPDFPSERIRYILNHSRAGIVLTSSEMDKDLIHYHGDIIALESDSSNIEENAVITVNDIPKNELAYVIYTSGSTGNPKGVEVPHKALTNFLLSMVKSPGIDDSDTMLALTTISFDISIMEIFLPLIVGAKLVVASKDILLDGVLLKETIAKHDISIMQATPSSWELLLSTGWNNLEELKVLCGGEPLRNSLAEKLISYSGGIWNMYGPTETTIWSTCCYLKNTDNPISIGRPIANTEIYLLNRDLQPVPIGSVGEICIGGAGVANGYIHNEELTNRQFIRNPFESEGNDRLYKTGDLARYEKNGNLVILGRDDHQIKVNGCRIESAEIEKALDSHPKISKSIVSGFQNARGNKYIVAFYTKLINESVETSEIMSYVMAKLPSQMIPAMFINLDDFPLTPNGKVDRKRLPDPEKLKQSDTNGYIAPRNQSERLLAQMWGDILKVDKVGIGERFFEIGGTSLLGAHVVTQIKQVFKIDMSIAKLFQHPTIDTLASFINQDNTNEQLDVSIMSERTEKRKNVRKKRQKRSRQNA